MKELFIKATKRKYRFETSKGLITVEQLWDIPLTSKTSGFSLDDIAKCLYRKVKSNEEESFVIKKSVKNEEFEDKLEITKYIINTRLEEKEKAKKAKEKAQQKQKILALIEDKEDEELKDKSKEELLAMLD